MKTVYHASTAHITEFRIPLNGLHFGTKESALQAVTYKRDKLENGNLFYLHKVIIDDSTVEDTFDCGEDWRYEIGDEVDKLWSYTNKYEPSVGKSYVMFDTKFIKQMVSVEQLNLEDFDEFLTELLNED